MIGLSSLTRAPGARTCCCCRYEDLRRAGLHVVLDTMNALKEFERKERILFLSHQWYAALGVPGEACPV